MQWIVQDFEDNAALVAVLERLDIPHSVHKVVPFIGELSPEPDIADPSDTLLYGSYTLWRYAERHGLIPGVFRLRPFLHETPWQPFMLNGTDAHVLALRDVPARLPDTRPDWFIRPVDDSKAVPGRIWSREDIIGQAHKVCALAPDEIPGGALQPDTELMFTVPARISKEWRLWIVQDQVVTHSLYKEGRHVVYRPEIDEDALSFAQNLIAANPGYAPAYVMDICRAETGLRLLETNCLNAAGFYAADLNALVQALEDM